MIFRLKLRHNNLTKSSEKSIILSSGNFTDFIIISQEATFSKERKNMLKANYTEEEKSRFQELRYNHPDKRVMRRFEVLWLHACGKHAPEIATLVGQNPYTVRDVIGMFKKGGVELVRTMDSHRPTSELEEYRAVIVEEFTIRPPATAKEAAFRIEKLTGIKRSLNRVRAFLKKIGLKIRKVAAVSAKADLAAQADFKKKSWRRR